MINDQVNSSRKKLKKSDNKDLDEAVFTWFKNARSNNIPFNGIIIKENAQSLAKSLELTDFQASDGWLHKWKRRQNVTFKAVSGEENAVTPEMIASWSEAYLPTILSKYQLKDIYNADDFVLFYQALPDKSLHYKGERFSGGKHSKVRLTWLAAASATWKKLPLFVIGKSAKPYCFSGVKSLPCRYRSQKKELDGWGFVYRMGEGTWPKICSSKQEDRFDCPQLRYPSHSWWSEGNWTNLSTMERNVKNAAYRSRCY